MVANAFVDIAEFDRDDTPLEPDAVRNAMFQIGIHTRTYAQLLKARLREQNTESPRVEAPFQRVFDGEVVDEGEKFLPQKRGPPVRKIGQGFQTKELIMLDKVATSTSRTTGHYVRIKVIPSHRTNLLCRPFPQA